MAMTGAEAETVGRGGIAALQRGDGAAARAAFELLVAAGRGGGQVRLLLAQACRLAGDSAGEEAALDQLLAAEPGNIQALLMRGDCYGRSGDRRAATSFYQAALAAGRLLRELPPGLATQLQRAETLIREAGGDYQAHLERSLTASGVEPAAAGRRFEEALDILFGRRQVYFQQPSSFYFPGLPQIQFYERASFDWAASLEAETPAIRGELLALLEAGADFRPYVEAEQNRPHRDFHGMQDDPSWGAFYLWEDGALVEENAAGCPRTVAALERVPMTRMGARTPSVLFSMLRPGAHIPPHHGMLNTRLICHLPLIVPPGCWLRVGNETREWEEGQLLIFDDSIEHEAKNPTEEVRVILLFDIWRPELTEEEKRGVSAIFEAIDDYGRGARGA